MSPYLMNQPELASDDTDLRETVLIIDDDHAMVDILSRRLRQQGFHTLTTETGERGLATAQLHYPSLILLDLRLPDADGLTICRQLADAPDMCDIPVIILSGMEHANIIRGCRAAGCQYFVRKPYDPNALLVLIRQAIRERYAWAGP
ncbi:MAG: response regulator, partial [Planctomycetota bacterium]